MVSILSILALLSPLSLAGDAPQADLATAISQSSTTEATAPAPANAPAPENPPIEQPFDLDKSLRMAVEVTVGGQGPFSFLVDTGAERTIIARELANRLAMESGRKLHLATISGERHVPSHRVVSLEMSALRYGAFYAPTFAGRHIGAAGLIGVDMLQKQRVLIDFTRQTMRITEAPRRKRIDRRYRDENIIVVTARRRAGRLILSNARIGGRRIDLIVDTGAQTSIGNMALKRLVQKRRQNTHPMKPATLVGVDGRTIDGEQTGIKRISLEGAQVTNLPISFVDAHAFKALDLYERPAMLLGMDAMQLFDQVEIDFRNRRVIFTMPKTGHWQRLNQHIARAPTQQ